MASQELAERTDIHKSCKSLEGLLNVFNDYCEAAGAVVVIEKKLAKALKETAGLKITGTNASSAFSASASIFDALTDIDSKYTKIVDKEYDLISTEVKKWFKRLAKEEKLHDERLTNANAKIRQAGQNFDRKAKRNARDAGDEHTRYMNLISSIGPEIAQEKYSHSLLITQRHSATTHSVAACIARVADAEWLRVCEGVRRYAPNVGYLGEQRAFCEGGWVGNHPDGLPDIDTSGDRLHVRFDPQPVSEQNTPIEHSPAVHTRDLPQPAVSPRKQSMEESRPPPSSFERPGPRPHVDPNTGSVRSLSAFPAPPTHFPVPSPNTVQRPGSRGPLPNPTSPRMSPVLSSRNPEMHDTTPRPSMQARRSTQEIRHDPPLPPDVARVVRDSPISSSSPPQPQQSYSQDTQSDIPRRGSPNSTSNSESLSSLTRTHGRGDYMGDELGSRRPIVEQRPQTLERSDTASSSGFVAAIRSKYSQNSGTASPPPREIPKLPLSVSDLATRYQVQDDQPASPRSRPVSPFMPGRPLPSIDGRTSPTKTHRHHSSLPVNNLSNEETRILEKEKELREREREVDQRTQELDMQLNKMNARGGIHPGQAPTPPLSATPRPTFPKRSSSQLELAMQMTSSSRALNHSGSTTSLNLVAPPSPVRQRRLSQEPPPSRTSTDHSPSCGCEACSTSKYKSSGPSTPIMYLRPNSSEKKSWMRRLSMPIVNPGKKNAAHKSGLSSLDSKKNFSSTMLHGGIPEDEPYGGNRSVTSLGLRQ